MRIDPRSRASVVRPVKCVISIILGLPTCVGEETHPILDPFHRDAHDGSAGAQNEECMVEIVQAELHGGDEHDEKRGELEGQVVEQEYRDSFGEDVLPGDIIVAEVMLWITLVGVGGLDLERNQGEDGDDGPVDEQRRPEPAEITSGEARQLGVT